jgi:Zn-dependent peptidase ImmA (M78 family)
VRIRWAPRAEFTIYHEITHHLLDEDGEILEHFTDLLANDSVAFDREIERCCDRGAAEFLMPRTRVAETN